MLLLKARLPQPASFPDLLQQVYKLLLRHIIVHGLANESERIVDCHCSGPRTGQPRFCLLKRSCLSNDDPNRNKACVIHVQHPVKGPWSQATQLQTCSQFCEEEICARLEFAHLCQVFQKAVPGPAAAFFGKAGCHSCHLQRWKVDGCAALTENQKTYQSLKVATGGRILKIHEVHHQLQVLQCEGARVRSVGVRKHLLYLQIVAFKPIVNGRQNQATPRFGFSHAGRLLAHPRQVWLQPLVVVKEAFFRVDHRLLSCLARSHDDTVGSGLSSLRCL
mmetsp:Transcript_56010/g.122485  ORF Transcript_56010/g.122485 Transcript_56010/m.122485 type:complete len:277 (-) Transcript_56010:713-1543(-)